MRLDATPSALLCGSRGGTMTKFWILNASTFVRPVERSRLSYRPKTSNELGQLFCSPRLFRSQARRGREGEELRNVRSKPRRNQRRAVLAACLGEREKFARVANDFGRYW